ncbi:MAG: ABC transporter ATP-binding protein [Pelagibaca sp.]
MTPLFAFLEDFGTPVPANAAHTVSDETLENERLESFDKGYRAGWDDAIKAKTDEGTQLADGIAQNLQDLSFTYHDVHAQILSNIGPLFDEILNKILPSLARDTLGAHVADQLTRIARDIGPVQIEIVVAPGSAEHVSQLVNGAATSLPIKVVEDADVPEGRADMRLGRKELSVDLSDVTAQISQAVYAVLHEETGMRAHG